MPITLTNAPPGVDLVTSARALENPTLAAVNAGNPSALAALISAASRAIERACKRTFAAQDYRVFLTAGGQSCEWIALPQFPVLRVYRLATAPRPVLSVINSDASTNQRAGVETTATSLILSRVASGSAASDTLNFADYPTIAALATAVAGLGNGWSASAVGSFGAVASSDLRPLQGSAPALGRAAELDAYTQEFSPWNGTSGSGWRLDADAGMLIARFGALAGGTMEVQCDYRAGFETIPVDIQQACVRLAALIQEDQQHDSGVKQSLMGPYRETYYPAAQRLIGHTAVMELIAPYVDHAKSVGRIWP